MTAKTLTDQVGDELIDMELELHTDKITEQGMEISALRKSRDDLLEALKQISDRDCFDPPTLDNLIRNTEALKEKEETK